MTKVKKIIDEAKETKNPELDLADKGLSSFDEIPGLLSMYNLTRITLTHNKISVVPPALANLNNLEILNLFNNQIEELPTSLSSMPKLRILNLGMNKLTMLPRGFGAFPALEVLDLTYNNLVETSLPGNFFMIETLRALYLGDNDFERLPAEIGQLKNLQILVLRDNDLIEIPKEIGDLPRLRELHIQGNRLSVLPPEIGNLDLTSNKSVLKMENNPWVAPILDQFQVGLSHVIDYIRSETYKFVYGRHISANAPPPARCVEGLSKVDDRGSSGCTELALRSQGNSSPPFFTEYSASFFVAISSGRTHCRCNFNGVDWKSVAVKLVSTSSLSWPQKCPTICCSTDSRLVEPSQSRGSHARRHFHSSTSNLKWNDRQEMIKSMPRVDEGTQGEKILDVDHVIGEKTDIFPDENLPDRLFGGVRFAELPVCNIKASPNNTIMTLTNAAGMVQLIHSCGREGFKNTREGTNIAAQATAITMGMKITSKGYKNVRVTVRGMGPGRISAIKGLTMAGVNVVSVTDVTPITFGWMPRPKKQRKLLMNQSSLSDDDSNQGSKSGDSASDSSASSNSSGSDSDSSSGSGSGSESDDAKSPKKTNKTAPATNARRPPAAAPSQSKASKLSDSDSSASDDDQSASEDAVDVGSQSPEEEVPRSRRPQPARAATRAVAVAAPRRAAAAAVLRKRDPRTKGGRPTQTRRKRSNSSDDDSSNSDEDSRRYTSVDISVI
nr:EOG090X0DZ9 [Sida crystallina]